MLGPLGSRGSCFGLYYILVRWYTLHVRVYIIFFISDIRWYIVHIIDYVICVY